MYRYAGDYIVLYYDDLHNNIDNLIYNYENYKIHKLCIYNKVNTPIINCWRIPECYDEIVILMSISITEKYIPQIRNLHNNVKYLQTNCGIDFIPYNIKYYIIEQPNVNIKFDVIYEFKIYYIPNTIKHLAIKIGYINWRSIFSILPHTIEYLEIGPVDILKFNLKKLPYHLKMLKFNLISNSVIIINNTKNINIILKNPYVFPLSEFMNATTNIKISETTESMTILNKDDLYIIKQFSLKN